MSTRDDATRRLSTRDDATRLRRRAAACAAEAMRLSSEPTHGSPCLPARTKAITSYPNAAACFYACDALTVMGAEVEGGPGAVTVDPATVFALNLGTAVPPPGTVVLATFVGHRWVFRYDG